jgi:type IV secretory pathway VirJ component
VPDGRPLNSFPSKLRGWPIPYRDEPGQCDSGDGGWRDIVKTIAQKLCSDGVSVIGWDSLHYFWSRKSPAQIANDLSMVIEAYPSRWGISKVALIGYSFGTGILPFAYERLTQEAKQRVVQISLRYLLLLRSTRE